MVMDTEAKLVVMNLVAALQPLTGHTVQRAHSDDPEVDVRLIAGSTYRDADDARAAAIAALASATSP